MKRTLTGLVLSAMILASVCRAADQLGSFVIEHSHVELAVPLNAEDMQRFAAGIPPRVRAFPGLSHELWPGFFTFRCGSCGDTCTHNADSGLQFRFGQTEKFSAADLIGLAEAQGIRVLRGPDGAIQQAHSQKNVYFVSQEKDVIVVEKYMAYDCETTPDGRKKTLHGATCHSRCEVRDVGSDPAKGIRRFQTLVFYESTGTMLLVNEFQETKGRVQSISLIYKGDEPSPEKLNSQVHGKSPSARR